MSGYFLNSTIIPGLLLVIGCSIHSYKTIVLVKLLGIFYRRKLRIEKHFQRFLEGQMRKLMRKKSQPSVIKTVGGDRVWEVASFYSFLWIKSYLCIKKILGEKIRFSWSVKTLVIVKRTSLRKQKSFSCEGMGPFNHSDVLLLTLELKMVELGALQCSRRNSVSVY